MKLTDLFAEQLDREAEANRRVLERVPEGRNDWKPHEKSMPLGYLAALVAVMPRWVEMVVERDELDFAHAAETPYHPQVAASRAELLALLDESVAAARRALAATSDEHLMRPWRFLAGGKLMDEQPRYVVLLDTTFAHLAHHRGQLTVYLRLNEAPVPGIYGPSADEPIAG
jgi:uncharacterized damage-inducible protein DinB